MRAMLMMGAWKWALSLAFFMLVISATSVSANSATWTNTANGAVGYWTNNANWNPSVSYPGNGAGDTASLTQNVNKVYTNILDTTLLNVLSNLVVSNASGQAWLIVTNCTLTNNLCTISSGGRLQIDNGGTVWVTNLASSGILAGTNGTIWLNNGGQLSTTGVVYTVGCNGQSGITGLVTTASATGGVWNCNGGHLHVGWGSNNLFNVDNVTITNVNNLYMGWTATDVNTLNIRNGANVFINGSLNAGYMGSSFFNIGGTGAPSFFNNNGIASVQSTLNITNATLLSTVSGSSKQAIIGTGNGNSYCKVNIMSGGIWEFRGSGQQGINLGSSFASTGNVFTVNCGTLICTNGSANAGNLIGGGASTIGNSLIVTNGGQFIWDVYVTTIGAVGSCSNNLVVAGGNSLVPTVMRQGSSLAIGSTASTGNVARIDGMGVAGGAVVTGAYTKVTIGNAATAAGNQLNIMNGGLLFCTNSGANSGLYVGYTPGGGINNSVLVTNGGILVVDSMQILLTGNTISNIGGIYQFHVANPTITPNGIGNIAISNGWISFCGVNGVDVKGNWSGTQLANMTFSGTNNTFRLNNSSGTNTYWFDAIAGASTNYAGLEMVSGNTAYTNGSVTIGTNGWLTYSNTTAVMWGAVTNYGQMTINNSFVTFTNGLVLKNGGTLISTSNFPIRVSTLVLPSSMVYSNASGMSLGDSLTVLTATNIIGSPSGWTVYPNNHRVSINGNSLVLSPRQPGFLIYVQ